jgi:hypothetical protein
MKLPVIETIRSAFHFFWDHRIQFFNLALPPVVILAILNSLVWPSNYFESNFAHFELDSSTSPSEIIAVIGSLTFFSGLLSIVLMIAVFSLYSVAWHRSFMLPGEDITIRECYRWQVRHWIFLWSNIKIFLLIIPIGIAGFALTVASLLFAPIVMILVMFFTAICYARFSMWLPAAAMDHQLTLNEVLTLTKGNGWQLAAILILTAIATGILDFFASVAIVQATNSLGVVGELSVSLLSNLAFLLVTYAGMAIGISALSIAYQFLTKQSQFKQPAP